MRCYSRYQNNIYLIRLCNANRLTAMLIGVAIGLNMLDPRSGERFAHHDGIYDCRGSSVLVDGIYDCRGSSVLVDCIVLVRI